jgi:hypothetical protein
MRINCGLENQWQGGKLRFVALFLAFHGALAKPFLCLRLQALDIQSNRRMLLGLIQRGKCAFSTPC